MSKSNPFKNSVRSWAKKDKEERTRLLKKRVSVVCEGHEKAKRPQNDRAKYGFNRCDGYSFSYSFAHIFANALYQYIADARGYIVREDWDVIEKHADAIRAYTEFDGLTAVAADEVGERIKMRTLEADFRDAMHWLTENWNGLWW